MGAVEDFLKKNKWGRFFCLTLRCEQNVKDCRKRAEKLQTHMSVDIKCEKKKGSRKRLPTPEFVSCIGCPLLKGIKNYKMNRYYFNKELMDDMRFEARTSPSYYFDSPHSNVRDVHDGEIMGLLK